MVNLSAQLQAAGNNLNMANEDITSLETEIMDRIREGLEANNQIAILRAEMERREKKAKEDVELERRINVGLSRELTSFRTDLDALRRILPVAARHIRTIELQERQLLEEEVIFGYFLRKEIEQTFIEILENRKVRLPVIIEGTNELRKASLRKSDHALYRAWEEEDAHCWKVNRFLLCPNFSRLSITDYGEIPGVRKRQQRWYSAPAGTLQHQQLSRPMFCYKRDVNSYSLLFPLNRIMKTSHIQRWGTSEGV
ncbi:hypothetical protein Aduo_003189 [Ancylostoma duodenale]